MTRSSAAILASALLPMLLLQCRMDERIAYEAPAAPPELITPTSVADAGPVTYCPSNKCPAGQTTCPGSRFLCDVNVSSDPNNCGGCGRACPRFVFDGGITTDPHAAAVGFHCVEGSCVLSCDSQIAMDCDGIVDNGCETLPSDPKNCGACGNACTDPSKPCVRQPDNTYACGCPAGTDSCGSPLLGCLSLEGNDYGCGACFNVCNPNGDGGARPPNAYFGCAGTECGHLKCTSGMGNCDGDSLNGCETPLTTNENCGSCKNACPAGESCLFDRVANTFKCLCPAGLTYCDGRCVDLASDPENCGTCGNACSNGKTDQYVASCSYGTCQSSCARGWSDCNGNPDDGCEVNTNIDPRNCGGCGVVCDGIAGQACGGGRCLVERCNLDGGTVAR